ncbi:DUF3558 domain-containing protein [Actinopolyspora erythraea]|uniref:DUF3558 domain-containing protein n=1 Tax=Actinopolyspora erythraea TaxID=414996 RepID=A0A099D973_9ACTN|nr:DUF3558 family protein [Actinopolyspora erythraea]ASU80608.1 DUF3558 domain-containing protein [Actinopolyspora erythraea]KGI82713.1 hypothetical protein IL38_02160 [Actinopolyspora erythraea]
MIGRGLRGAAVLLAGLGLVSACGSSDRPRELSVSDVKPCELINKDSLQGMRITQETQKLDFVPGVEAEGSTCFYTTRVGNRIYVNTITNRGIDRWINSSDDDVRSEEVSRIQGFRSVRVWFDSERPDPDHKCRVYVDVAGGQSLEVRVEQSYSDEDPPTCTTARRFAEAAMNTLAD